MIIILGSFAPHAESEPREHKNLKKYDGNKVQGVQKILPDPFIYCIGFHIFLCSVQ